jgi:diacylglycerol kinase family enzyme
MTTTTNLFTINNQTIKLLDNDSYQLEIADGESSGTTIEQLPEYLHRKIVVIDSINSGSGRTNKDVYKSILKPLFDKFLINHDYIKTESSSSIETFSKNLVHDDYLIICISGDTSINELVNNLEFDSNGNNSIAIFPIPAGTGNSLALSLDITDISTAIVKLFTGKISDLNLYQVDLPNRSNYLINQKKIPITKPVNFLVVFSWGFHASLVADSDTPELRKFGLNRFKMAAADNLSRDQTYKGNYSILGSNNSFSGPFSYWVLTAAKKFEPTFEILPDGNILERNLYVISFKNDVDIVEIMNQVYQNGSHVKNPVVAYEKVDNKLILNIITENDIERRFCVDGAIVCLPDVKEQSIEVKPLGNIYNNWIIEVLH